MNTAAKLLIVSLKMMPLRKIGTVNAPDVLKRPSIRTKHNIDNEKHSISKMLSSSETVRRSTLTRSAHSDWLNVPSLFIIEVPDENLLCSLGAVGTTKISLRMRKTVKCPFPNKVELEF